MVVVPCLILYLLSPEVFIHTAFRMWRTQTSTNLTTFHKNRECIDSSQMETFLKYDRSKLKGTGKESQSNLFSASLQLQVATLLYWFSLGRPTKIFMFLFLRDSTSVFLRPTCRKISWKSGILREYLAKIHAHINNGSNIRVKPGTKLSTQISLRPMKKVFVAPRVRMTWHNIGSGCQKDK